MKLTKKQFRLSLALYCAVVLSGMVYSRSLPQRAITSDYIAQVMQAKKYFGMRNFSDVEFATVTTWLAVLLLTASLVGLLFVFFLWREGLYIFLIAACARVLFLSLYHPSLHISTTGKKLFGLVEFLFELGIVATGFFGPAKHLFQRNGHESNHTLQPTRASARG